MGTSIDRRAGRRLTPVAVAALAVMLAFAALGGDAEAKKKKKKPINPGSTVTSVLTMGSSTSVAGAASCRGKTHATGGGFAVAPTFSPPSTGLRTLNSTSNPSGTQGWAAGGSAYASPIAAGQFTTFARCERNTAGRISIRASSSLTLAPGAGQNLVFDCPSSSHAISGGYAAPSLAAFSTAFSSHRIVVVQSRRTGPGQWTISAYNNPNSPASANLTGYAVCELNAKGSAVTEAASPLAPVIDDGRTAADATCTGKTHSVSGGFLVSHAFPGAVPLVSVDESHPVGKGRWHTGLWEFPQVILPASTSLQTFAYCKKG